MNDFVLTLRGVQVIADGKAILDAPRLEILAGQSLAVVGDNGAGKTTLLRVCAGMLAVTAGQVRWFGGQPSPDRSLIGYLPQFSPRAPLLPLSVREVVAIGRTGLRGWSGRLHQDDWSQVDAWMERLGLRERADQPFTSLSGGFQRRVLLARVLVQEPRLLILDEPAAHLDARTRRELLGLIHTLMADPVLTCLLATHEPDTVPQGVTRVLELSDGRL